MLQHYTSTKVAGTATDAGGSKTWTNPSNAKVEDGNLATCSTVGPGGGGGTPNQLNLTNFGFTIPNGAVIDGIYVEAKVQTTGGTSGNDTGRVWLLYNGGSTNPVDTPNDGQTWSATLNWIAHGDITTLWNRSWTPAEINHTNFGASLASMPGTGTADINIDSVQITVYWHIDLATAPADVPTRVAYKVYSRDGKYLGDLPEVTSLFGFSQDINSAGSGIQITCGVKAENTTTTEAILDDTGAPIQTNDSLPILANDVDTVVAEGASDNYAIFKNSNRIKIWVYNYWYPNGKIMFSGQVNKVSLSIAGDSSTTLMVLSDGADLNNFIARGFPFSYSTDVTQSSQNGWVAVTQGSGKLSGSWQRYGQTWLVGGGVNNLGAIVLKLQGTATVTVSAYDAPNGNLIGSISKNVSAPTATDVQFEMAQLLTVVPAGTYFMDVAVAPGQTIKVYKHATPGTYANGSMYSSTYSGGSGGGSYLADVGDFYFITKYGTPTTTTTYSTTDPVTGMMSGILSDYNARGGYITERDFLATGLSTTYTFNQMTIYDAMRKVLELSQTGYYGYVDLGTAEMDILQESLTADFTLVRGTDINELDLTLTIEQVKNYLLFSGGDTGGGVNLYRDYQDSESASFYGLRTVPQTDNRVTLSATADAIGDSFIAENSDETQETNVTIPVTAMDISLLIPGKNIGFRNFGSFVDSMVLQIVRRDFTTKAVTLALGRLPVRTNDQIQRINRGLLNEQTIDNPAAPS